MNMYVWLQGSLFNSFSTQNLKKCGFDSYLKQEFRKWVLEKEWVPATRDEDDEEDEDNEMVPILCSMHTNTPYLDRRWSGEEGRSSEKREKERVW